MIYGNERQGKHQAVLCVQHMRKHISQSLSTQVTYQAVRMEVWQARNTSLSMAGKEHIRKYGRQGIHQAVLCITSIFFAIIISIITTLIPFLKLICGK